MTRRTTQFFHFPLRYTFGHRFNESDRAWLFDRMNQTAYATTANLTHSASKAAAGNPGTDVSYNNMYYMNMVNVALLGEIVQNHAAAEMGYRLIDDWLQYQQTADLHEFTSPTYYVCVFLSWASPSNDMRLL